MQNLAATPLSPKAPTTTRPMTPSVAPVVAPRPVRHRGPTNDTGVSTGGSSAGGGPSVSPGLGGGLNAPASSSNGGGGGGGLSWSGGGWPGPGSCAAEARGGDAGGSGWALAAPPASMAGATTCRSLRRCGGHLACAVACAAGMSKWHGAQNLLDDGVAAAAWPRRWLSIRASIVA